MKMQQIATAILNDRTTETERAKALAFFANGGDMHTAVHMLLPVVFAELKKPIYAGVTFDDTSWTAAAHVLDMDIQSAIDAKGATK